MALRLVTIATFNQPTEAHILKGRLESEGIPCYLGDEHIVGAHPFYSVAVGGVKLQVAEQHEAEARHLVELVQSGRGHLDPDDDIELAPFMQEHEPQTCCPICDSEHVQEENYSKTVFSFVYLLLGFPPPFFKRKYKCSACGYAWKQKK
ncbi:DUF2007 domain-containing protein [Pontibacter qinzhouensis]|uniref:DUF2007 domain-containing protein n=1 Tax=Pontibacter qinzhouensis TaxID=2603253 RepID=A0A5C8JLU3_9BACT|nr:DUF2007 domain-containing protein [Pontibacter qinzhouensis]TXK37996.1 DUF2007 domain-containing protein [Pontibacter qinzhouensis]